MFLLLSGGGVRRAFKSLLLDASFFWGTQKRLVARSWLKKADADRHNVRTLFLNVFENLANLPTGTHGTNLKSSVHAGMNIDTTVL
jgi:hypothetical protein